MITGGGRARAVTSMRVASIVIFHCVNLRRALASARSDDREGVPRGGVGRANRCDARLQERNAIARTTNDRQNHTLPGGGRKTHATVVNLRFSAVCVGSSLPMYFCPSLMSQSSIGHRAMAEILR